jgi:rubrerythrin
MKHFLLKFNHGVEIGAYLAYVGHASRTKSSKVWSISRDELYHREGLKFILDELGEKPSPWIDRSFTLIGKTIKWLCRFSPLWSLDLIARSMELFAIFNYNKLAIKYPQYAETFEDMAKSEQDHEEYFRLSPEAYQNLQALRASIIAGHYGMDNVKSNKKR